MREREWADKEVRGPEIRSWEPPGGSQFGDNQMAVLPLHRLQSLCLEKWDKNKKRGETTGSLHCFPRLPWECQPSVAAPRVFSYLHSVTICYFPAWLMKSPVPAGPTEISALHSGSENSDGQEGKAAGSHSPWSDLSGSRWVVVATHISSCWSLVLCCWLLPDLVNEGPRLSGLQTNAAGETECDQHLALRDE